MEVKEKLRSKRNNGFYCICKCATCSKEFRREYSRAIKSKHSFCSRKCYTRWQCINRIKENSPCFGKKWTKETRKRISESLKIDIEKNGSHNWKGGRVLHLGYVMILKPEHPNCNSYGYIYEHRLVMEKFLDRYLTNKEVVHHENGINNDNRIENLMLFSTNGEHTRHHGKIRN